MDEGEKKEGTERREGGTLYPGMAAEFLYGGIGEMP